MNMLRMLQVGDIVHTISETDDLLRIVRAEGHRIGVTTTDGIYFEMNRDAFKLDTREWPTDAPQSMDDVIVPGSVVVVNTDGTGTPYVVTHADSATHLIVARLGGDGLNTHRVMRGAVTLRKVDIL